MKLTATTRGFPFFKKKNLPCHWYLHSSEDYPTLIALHPKNEGKIRVIQVKSQVTVGLVIMHCYRDVNIPICTRILIRFTMQPT